MQSSKCRLEQQKKTIPRCECNRAKFYLLHHSIALRTLLLSPLDTDSKVKVVGLNTKQCNLATEV